MKTTIKTIVIGSLLIVSCSSVFAARNRYFVCHADSSKYQNYSCQGQNVVPYDGTKSQHLTVPKRKSIDIYVHCEGPRGQRAYKPTAKFSNVSGYLSCHANVPPVNGVQSYRCINDAFHTRHLTVTGIQCNKN